MNLKQSTKNVREFIDSYTGFQIHMGLLEPSEAKAAAQALEKDYDSWNLYQQLTSALIRSLRSKKRDRVHKDAKCPINDPDFERFIAKVIKKGRVA